MHRDGRILVLPNAWDAASARVFEEAGFGAIATTSAGIAFTLGYPDGQRISREEMLGVVRRITAAVQGAGDCRCGGRVWRASRGCGANRSRCGRGWRGAE